LCPLSSSFYGKVSIERLILGPVVLLRVVGISGLVGPEGFYKEVFG